MDPVISQLVIQAEIMRPELLTVLVGAASVARVANSFESRACLNNWAVAFKT